MPCPKKNRKNMKPPNLFLALFIFKSKSVCPLCDCWTWLATRMVHISVGNTDIWNLQLQQRVSTFHLWSVPSAAHGKHWPTSSPQPNSRLRTSTGAWSQGAKEVRRNPRRRARRWYRQGSNQSQPQRLRNLRNHSAIFSCQLLASHQLTADQSYSAVPATGY